MPVAIIGFSALLIFYTDYQGQRRLDDLLKKIESERKRIESSRKEQP